MTRRLLLFAAVLVSAAGCGRSLPSTPMERGAALVHDGRYGDAIDAYTEAIQLKPSDAQAYLLRGRAHHGRNQAGDLEAAIADFSAAIGFDSNNSEAYYNRSMAYRDIGDADKAREDAEVARKLDGQVAETYLKLPETTSIPPIDADAIAAEAQSAAAQEAASAAPKEALESASELRRRLEAEAESNDYTGGTFSSGGTRPLGSSRDYDPRGLSGSRSGRRNPAADRRRAAVNGTATGNQPDADSRRTAVDPTRAADSPLARDSRANPITAPGSPAPSAWPYSAGANVRPKLPTPGETQYQSTYQAPPQSPFPQLPPRPTGYVEPQVIGPVPAQSRPYFTAPYSPYPRPTNQLPGARHFDYNP